MNSLDQVMKRTRGAARISLVWMISLIVLFFVSLGLSFVAFQEKAKIAEELEVAKLDAAEADSRESATSATVTAISEAVGYYDPLAATARTDVDTLTSGFDQLRTAFPDLGSDVKTLADALPVAIQAYGARGAEIAQLEQQVGTLETEKSTLDQSLRDASSEKDTVIADLQRQISDQSDSAASKQTELESRIDSLRSQNSDLDAEVRRLRGEKDDVARAHEEEIAILLTRHRERGKVLEFLQEPERADAKILSVSDGLPLGWIDIGTRNRLALGTRFRVISGEIGSDRLKAWAEVTGVKPDMAQVRFFDLVDRFDPVSEGDVVYNPVYDPVGGRRAVLAGRFSGRYNESELRALLGNMGIAVQSEIGIDTDYLIVGSELYLGEDGEPLEEPVQPHDLTVYKEAEANGVIIVALKDLYSYFRY